VDWNDVRRLSGGVDKLGDSLGLPGADVDERRENHHKKRASVDSPDSRLMQPRSDQRENFLPID
jgi:hypothetical protein